ncbi:hypothetical protein [Parasphingopyxis sp.]|uniref:hypothetical protein n=1 Tax=Parasphingopyxis sp. TaxID=1920299 RepID=UPI002616FF5D|nr:hypothetical protein [Parasphingopyxis sp.]
MGPAFYILAIMGCGDDVSPCIPLMREDRVFRTEAACQAEIEDALMRATDLPYPTLAAQCQNVSSQVAAYWGDTDS